jgi:monoamine oxidase
MFNVGNQARNFSQMTDAQLLANAMNVIRKWYPNAPNYTAYYRSNWGQDTFAMGSYPFIKAGSSPSDCEAY